MSAIRIPLAQRCVASHWLQAALLIAVFFATNPSALCQSRLAARAADRAASPLSGQPDSETSFSLLAPLKQQKRLAAYIPLTPRQRLRWFLTETFGPSHIAGGVLASGLGTALNRPAEYGPHWGGLAERYGIRLTGIGPQSAMEAGLGLALGEDPRYFSARGLPFKARLVNVIKLTFAARRMDGSYGPAYARYIAISGSNFESNSWRVHGEANTQSALIRTAGGFAGYLAANAFQEFWPSVRDRFSRSR